MIKEIIVNDQIKLKVKEPKDAVLMFSLITQQREYLGKWLTWVPFLTSPMQQELVLQEAYLKTQNGESLDFGIWFEDNLVGSISLNEIDKQDNFADIGYWLSQDMQGQGIVGKSLEKLIAVAFNELNLHKLLLNVATDNLASNKVAKRAGMQLEATLKSHLKLKDGYHDLNIYSLWNPNEKALS